jgi:hypothetical protein
LYRCCARNARNTLLPTFAYNGFFFAGFGFSVLIVFIGFDLSESGLSQAQDRVRIEFLTGLDIVLVNEMFHVSSQNGATLLPPRFA